MKKLFFFCLILLPVTLIGQSPTDESRAYELLADVADVVTLNGNYTDKYRADEAQARGFDARNATFLTGNIQWGTVDINSGSSITDMVWAGGYFHSGKPWDASWADHKATSQPDLPGRNSAAIENRSTGTTLTGVYAHNVHDAFRSSSAVDWEVQHCWSSYTRDDAIENDKFAPGRVYDCIFDGVYSGISARPDDTNLDANGAVLTLRKVMVRLQAMPYPYKWDTRPQNVVDANNEPWVQGVSQGIPYGHGNFFKIVGNADPKNMHWDIKHCTFVANANMVNTSFFDFPDASLIDELENVTIVWLGDGPFPGYLPTNKFPGEITVLTGTAGLNHYWTRIRNWHNNHPDVEPARKPDPDTYYTPIVFPEIPGTSDFININAPSANDVLSKGSTYTIRWNDNIPHNVRVVLFKDDIYQRTLTSSTASDGNYSWTLANDIPTGDNYQIRVRSTVNLDIDDFSDNFSIRNATNLCDQIPNGTFDNGNLSGWNFIQNAGASGSSTSPWNRAQLSIDNQGTAIWHLAFQHDDITLEGGKTYQLKYEAKAWGNRNMSVFIQHKNDNYADLYREEVSLQNSWDTRPVATFTMPSDGEVVISFRVGTNRKTVILDNITLDEVGCPAAKEDALYSPDIQLFPNPASDNIQLTTELSENTQAQIQVYDAFGKLVKHITEVELIAGLPIDVEVTQLPAGMYFCTLKSGEWQAVKKFVIAR